MKNRSLRHPEVRLLITGGLLAAGLAGLAACAPVAHTDANTKVRGEAASHTYVVPAPTEAEVSAATDALFAALAANDLGAAETAISAGARINEQRDQGRTPVVMATKSQQTAMAVLLLQHGADPNIQDDIQDSAFLYAGAEGYDEILIETLAYGADVNAINRFGGTALIPASEHGYVSTVQILIEAGVPLDHINNLGWTALHEAIVLNNGGPNQVEVVKLLLSAGADPTIPDGNGVAPRQLAASRGFDTIVAEIDQALAAR